MYNSLIHLSSHFRACVIAFYLTFILFFIPLNVDCQTSYFRNYSVEDGLAFVYVTTITQDHDGNLWSGGYGGLSKFNGISFTNYGAKHGLIHHEVSSIAVDSKGTLWIGTSKGASVYSKDGIFNYTVHEGLEGNNINQILIDNDDCVWFGTNKGVSKFDGSIFSSITEKDGLISSNVLSLYIDSKKIMWFGTDKGVTRLDGAEFTSFDILDGLADNNINVIIEDNDGNIYFGTNNGLSVFDGTTFQNFGVKDGLCGNEIISIEKDVEGNIWIGTSKGLAHFDGREFKNYFPGTESNNNIIESLFIDNEGNLWIGTYSGLYKYISSAFVSFTEADGLKNNFIFQLFKDSYGLLWIGTNGGGLHIYDGRDFHVFTTKEGLSGDFVWSGLEDSKGQIWIGTDGGLSKCIVKNRKAGNHSTENPIEVSFMNYSKDDGLISDSINGIFEDSKGVLWLIGNGGVSTYLPADEQSVGYIFSKYRFSYVDNFMFWSAIEDKYGHIWFGAYEGGLFRYDGDNFINETRHMDFKSETFICMVKDSEYNLYFGTLHGVYMYDGQQLINFSEKDGLSSNLVWSMVIDETENNLWIGTNQGLNKLKLNEYKQSGNKVIENYGKNEGFTGVECNSNGICKDTAGVIWWGTINGLIKYDPGKYRKNIKETNLNITGVRIFYKDTVIAQHTTLPYNLNHISFTYFGVCLTNPQKVKYQYKLEGFEENWSPTTNINFATYANLPPGDYTFKVISCNNEEIWNTSPASFSFSIATPYWKTWWFRIGFVLVAAFAIWGIIYLRYHNLKKKNELTRRMDQLKLQALRSQMNPHFLFNAMNAVQHYINSNEKRLANIYLAKFADLIRLVLNNSHHTSVAIIDDLKALELYIELQQLRFENLIEYSIDIDKTIDKDNLKIPPLLIQPYVENAIIHGLLNKPEGGKVEIVMRLQDNCINCTITDDGVGRRLAEELNAQHRDIEHKPVGMKLTKERLEILNYSVRENVVMEVEDLVNENGNALGTKVTITIPLH